MNLIEALKTGRPIKRKDSMAFERPRECMVFHPDDVLADDWEVETLSVKITYDQLKEAYDKASDQNEIMEHEADHFKLLAEKLGLL